MACACKVNKQIDYLHKKYGHNIPVSKPTMLKFKIGEFFKKIWLYILIVPILPIMVLHVLGTALFGKNKTIKIKNLTLRQA